MPASGPISLPREKLVDLVAGSVSFRNRIAAGTSAEAARERVHWPHMQEDDYWRAERPFAVVMSTGLNYEHVAGGGKNYLRPQGALSLLLVDEDRAGGDLKASQIDFENFIGGVIADVAAQAGHDTELSVTAIRMSEQAAVTAVRDVPAAGLYWTAGFEITWGRI